MGATFPPTVSLLHATRGRPEQAAQARSKWLSAAKNPEQVEHIFAIDADDEVSLEGLASFTHHVVLQENGGCVAAWNLAAEHSHGKLLVQLSDDWEPIPHWDEAFLSRLGNLTEPQVLRVSDGHRRDDLLCMAICTHVRYEQQGFFLSPAYFGLYSDDEFSFRAYEDGVVVDARDLVFRHVHPHHDESVPLDETYQRQNAPLREIDGRKAFIARNPGALGRWFAPLGHGKYHMLRKSAQDGLPLISVIMRTHNRPQFLRRALESVGQQSYPNLEIVVVAQGEGCTYAPAALEDAAIPSTLVHARPGSSLGALLNQGITAATGKWVIALDDDDTWHHSCLERLASGLLAGLTPTPRAAACHHMIVHENVAQDGSIQESHRQRGGDNVDKLLISRQIGRNQVIIHAFLYERSLWAELAGYCETLKVAEDWDFNLRCVMRAEIVVIPEPLANYHLRHQASDQTQTANVLDHPYTRAHLTNRELRDATNSAEGRTQLHLAGQLSLTIEEVRDELSKLREELRMFRNRESALQKSVSKAKQKLKETQQKLDEARKANKGIRNAVEKWNRRSWLSRLFRRLRL